MTIATARAGILAAIVLLWGFGGVVDHAVFQKQDDAADAARLAELLAIGPGSVVADVGAGSGALVPFISTRVGAGGLLYATDVNADRLAELRALISKEKLTNVTVREGAAAATNLPEGCCDAVFMRLVYHHFGDPPAMNASLWRSLKPGGRLAVVEFAPRTGESAPPGQRNEGDRHGVMPATVMEELKAAGFVDIEAAKWAPPGFAVVARRPASDASTPARTTSTQRSARLLTAPSRARRIRSLPGAMTRQ